MTDSTQSKTAEDYLKDLSSKGLDPEDFKEWLGNQKNDGANLENWAPEELSKMVTMYIGLYGTKVSKVAKNASSTPQQGSTEVKDHHKPAHNDSRAEQPHPHHDQKSSTKDDSAHQKQMPQPQQKIVISVEPKRAPEPEPAQDQQEGANNQGEEHEVVLDATKVACIKIIR